MSCRELLHVKHLIAKLGIFLAIFFCIVTIMPRQLRAMHSDAAIAEHIAMLLGRQFEPELLSVSVLESRAYAEMRGIVLSGIRLDTMRLDALITNQDQPLVDDVDSLTTLIGYSRGELILLEKDVNAYFDNNDTRGFSGLVFDFAPTGFRADGVFTADFLFTLRIRLAATGILGLKSDGVYLEDVAIYVEKLRQPAALTNQIVSRVNPLLEWGDIPFKVEFDEVTMDDEAARMTGHPRPLEGGSTAVWREGRLDG